MSEKLAQKTKNLWDESAAAGLGDVESLAYRSNLLGSDRSVANFGGGNTSTKTTSTDHTGREIEVLFVKGSGSDLASIEAHQFTALKLDEVLPLKEREEMEDEEMVSYLARCQLSPEMPRGSIETLLHAFIAHPHVDHTHPDSINMICCSVEGERLAEECFGEEAIWLPYIRPGFTLSKQVAEALKDNPQARFVLLAKHGLVTWGETHEESYTRTVEAVNRAAEFVLHRATEPSGDFGGRKTEPLGTGEREDVLAEVLPTLRGALSLAGDGSIERKIFRLDHESHSVLDFVCGRDSEGLSQVGAACPDHLVRTKVKPLWLSFDPKTESAQTLKERVGGAVSDYRTEYEAYFSRHTEADEEMFDPNPRVVLIEGVGLVSAARTEKEAALSRDFYLRAISVMRGAHALGGYVSLSEGESYAVEYWPMELYKLSLAPPAELAGEVALVTGGAGGIGGAVSRSLAENGACVVVSDIDESGARTVAAELGESGVFVAADVSREEEVREMYRRAVLEYGGVDIIVSNAGFAFSAPVEETPVERWDEIQAVLLRGYFLVSREAFKIMGDQKTGGSIVFVASKNGLLSGRNNAAYASAKAGEMHLARCLAEEGGERGIRVNTVNPDAVIRGTKLWDSDWKEARASSYGIGVEDLETHYRERTTLKVNIEPEDLTEAVLFFASDARSSKSTGNILNVDGGVKDAYPR